MRWWQWLLVVLLLAGAVRALVGTGEAPPPASDVTAEDPQGDASGPSLETRGEEPADDAYDPEDPKKGVVMIDDPLAPAVPGLPSHLRKAAGSKWTQEHARALWAWVKEDPRRFLVLLAVSREGLKKSRVLNMPLQQQMAELGGSWVAAWQQHQLPVDHLPAPLHALLRERGHDAMILIGLMGALARLPLGAPPPWDTLRGVVLDPAVAPEAQAHAATLLFRRQWFGTERKLVPVSRKYTGADLTVLRRLIYSNRITGPELRHLIQGIREQPEVLKRVLPVLQTALKAGGNWGARRELYQSILALDDDSPEFRSALAEGMQHAHGGLRERMRKRATAGEADDVLAWMDTAHPYGRLEGIKALYARGVDPTRLHPHVLALMTKAPPTVLQGAIDLIPLLGVPDADVLDKVETLLQSTDVGVQVMGVKALGLLARNKGDHEGAIDRLFTVSRKAPDPKVRIVAVQSILMHEARPRAMVEMLTQLLGDTEAGVRSEAVDALGELAGEHADARQALEGARNDSNDEVRELIAYWLDETSPDDD